MLLVGTVVARSVLLAGTVIAALLNATAIVPTVPVTTSTTGYFTIAQCTRAVLLPKSVHHWGGGVPGSGMSQHQVGGCVGVQCLSCATAHFGECSSQDRGYEDVGGETPYRILHGTSSRGTGGVSLCWCSLSAE